MQVQGAEGVGGEVRAGEVVAEGLEGDSRLEGPEGGEGEEGLGEFAGGGSGGERDAGAEEVEEGKGEDELWGFVRFNFFLVSWIGWCWFWENWAVVFGVQGGDLESGTYRSYSPRSYRDSETVFLEQNLRQEWQPYPRGTLTPQHHPVRQPFSFHPPFVEIQRRGTVQQSAAESAQDALRRDELPDAGGGGEDEGGGGDEEAEGAEVGAEAGVEG